MCKGGNLFLQLIILSMESICIIFVTEFGTKSSRYSLWFVITPTNRFNLGHSNVCKEVTANFTNFSKGSDFCQIKQDDTELTESRDIIQHRSLDVNHIEHYSTEQS